MIETEKKSSQHPLYPVTNHFRKSAPASTDRASAGRLVSDCAPIGLSPRHGPPRSEISRLPRGEHHLVLLRRLRGGIVVGVRVVIQVSLGEVHMGLIACREPGGHQRMP